MTVLGTLFCDSTYVKTGNNLYIIAILLTTSEICGLLQFIKDSTTTCSMTCLNGLVGTGFTSQKQFPLRLGNLANPSLTTNIKKLLTYSPRQKSEIAEVYPGKHA